MCKTRPPDPPPPVSAYRFVDGGERRFLCVCSAVPGRSRRFWPPQQGDLRFSSHSSGQGAGRSGWTRTRTRRVLADLRADSLATVPPLCSDTTPD
ncbi:hypothetical protein PoB_005892100 [Plakobranchus ocellatus]|uniref:Uncharacterized protein n=1 Tax=Plakobranchus ocellatus TaxID=259542 RepID=A0AAV4CL80_9GAST|nr:hypothetical protein PoB_005892100 [Plakobranchus ocellatus]